MRETLSKRRRNKAKVKVAATRSRSRADSKKKKELKKKLVSSGRSTASASKQSKTASKITKGKITKGKVVKGKVARKIKQFAAVKKAVKKTAKRPSRSVKVKAKVLARKQVKAKAPVRKTAGKKVKAPARRAARIGRSSKSKTGSRSVVKTSTIASRSKSSGQVKIPVIVTPPPPPEPPRRQVSSGALRAFEQAVKVFNRRRFDDARTMFENLLTKFPGDFEIVARSQMYIQVCNQKLASETRPSSPRNADELYDHGVFALNIGDFTQARTFFEKALRLQPDEPHLLYSLAATHAQSGAHDQALAYLKRSIQIQPRLRSQAYNDSDFSGLRDNKQFLELIGLASPFDLLDSRR
jgi:tetratricopeptide (TPR) repeat protein